jgi:alpha-L-arabinofuranosidase
MMTRNNLHFILALVLSSVTVASGQSAASVTIQANQPGAVVSSNLFGIFFEEINYAGEGGLYAEMVRNRSFYTATSANFWTLVTQGTAAGAMGVDTNQPLNTNIVNSLKLTMTSGAGSVGAGNAGFWGMSLQTNATYNLSFYVMGSNGFTGPVSARLESTNGSTLYAQATFNGLTTNWQHFAAPLVSSGADTNARLVLSISNAGTVWLDMVSLFPAATYNNRTNGLRADLAKMLVALHPSFLRYPGGNFIESYTISNAVRWKKTIGDIAQRPGHMNDSWGYWSTDGYGLDEAFRQCEDMGMAPLYGINAGLMLNYNGSATNTVPLSDMGPWVQDALDLIEYANGDTNTTWGALRAANGHSAPYNLKLMEIGNENGGSYYDARYTLFYDAIKAKYPDVRLISPVWGTTPWSRPVEIRDEHYYSSPSTFISYATKYDSYSRSGPKVFVGEYAVTSGYGTYGNLTAALGEAAFMTGMERNSDVVQLASYAPLFANVNGIQWHPDLIYYDSSRGVFGTPSYYVQELFGQNRGNAVLPATVAVTTNSASSAPQGAIGVGAWSTSVQYTNIVVTSNGVTLYQSDFVNAGTNGWRVYNGTWSTNAGLYQQTSTSTTDCRSLTGDTNWANYTISLRARKVSGSEGFLILFNLADDNNWTWWNIGGWSNTADAVEQMVGGSKTTLASVSPATNIATGVWYDVRIVLTGSRMQCYLGTNSTQAATNLVQDVTYPSAPSGLIVSSTFVRSGNQILVKAVNPYSTPLATTFNIAGVNSIATNASVVQLTSGSATDENSLASPTHVFPVTNAIVNAGTNFTLTLPAYSLSVLRLNTGGLDSYTNLLLQCAASLYSGQTVASTVWGQLSGSWLNLTPNANHALTWSSANTNIAVVDISGNVTGVGSGTTSIIATYASLGLSATQSVQVVYVPVTLVHRYSFSEVSGTNVADSIGGAAWNGWLPNGGTFSGSGQLTLASNLSQYVRLPAGILSNYTAVTIDAWASFGTLPSACFFYGFGNMSGAAGLDYIFCQPQNGRIAITATNYSGEQNTAPNPSGSWSGTTNLHVTSVFNPPAGYLALYTNGVLAASNTGITNAMAVVSNLYSFIGRSLYSGDSYFDVSLDEFRIYSGALNLNEIAASQALGPDQLLSTNSPVIRAAASGGSLTLSWPVGSADYTVMTATNLAGGIWTEASVVPQIVSGQWQVTVPVAGNEQYYRLQR